MTVKELIEHLQKYDLDAPVSFNVDSVGYEIQSLRVSYMAYTQSLKIKLKMMLD